MSTAPLEKHSAIVPRPNDKRKIAEHYDFVSPYYQSLWGEHIHHGYRIRGDESKELARFQLIEHLAQLANLQTGSTVLDIGCGFGGTSLYLAQKYKACATASPSPGAGGNGQEGGSGCAIGRAFLLMDAEALDFPLPFDLLWSVESISDYHDHRSFFANAVRFLKPVEPLRSRTGSRGGSFHCANAQIYRTHRARDVC